MNTEARENIPTCGLLLLIVCLVRWKRCRMAFRFSCGSVSFAKNIPPIAAHRGTDADTRIGSAYGYCWNIVWRNTEGKVSAGRARNPPIRGAIIEPPCQTLSLCAFDEVLLLTCHPRLIVAKTYGAVLSVLSSTAKVFTFLGTKDQRLRTTEAGSLCSRGDH